MLKFKKEFENHSIALADGTLINKDTIESDYAQSRLAASSAFWHMLESDSVISMEVNSEDLRSEAPKKRVRK